MNISLGLDDGSFLFGAATRSMDRVPGDMISLDHICTYQWDALHLADLQVCSHTIVKSDVYENDVVRLEVG